MFTKSDKNIVDGTVTVIEPAEEAAGVEVYPIENSIKKEEKFMAEDMSSRIELFEKTPIPKAVMQLSVPVIISSLVMIVYKLADTFFVGMLNDPIQNAGVTLASPILLAFNAVTNLFGVGASSMMSRAMGCKDYETVKKTSSFAFWSSLTCAAIFSLVQHCINF